MIAGDAELVRLGEVAAAEARGEERAEERVRGRLGFTRDDANRLREIAGELEHLRPEIKRHFDQDGRDARYLRIVAQRILDSYTEQGGGADEVDEAVRASEGTDGHRIILEFDDGPWVKLIHPEGGCEPPEICAICHADLRDPEAKRCYDCKDIDPDGHECWLTAWAEERGCELIRGEVTLPIEVEWRDEYPLFHLAEAAS